MSTGARGHVEGLAPSAPAPPPGRAHILSRLEAERRQAEGCFERERAAELAGQIAALSRGDPVSPARETTGRRPAARKR